MRFLSKLIALSFFIVSSAANPLSAPISPGIQPLANTDLQPLVTPGVTLCDKTNFGGTCIRYYGSSGTCFVWDSCIV